MPATSYRIWGWGGEVEFSTTGARRIGIHGVAKPATPDHPNQVANEIICCDLGRALRLPIPPGFVVIRESDKAHYYVSADFSQAGEVLPPADPRAIVHDTPRLACGVLLFDLWTANADRHEANLSYDEDTKTLQLFDHGRALLCGKNGRKRLENIKDRDIISNHCLSAEISTMDGFNEWTDRIQQLPEYLIRESVLDIVKLGVSMEDAAFCSNFLLTRRAKLLELLNENKAVFVNVKQETLPGLN